MLLDKSLDFGHLLGLEAEVRGQLNVWVNPELRFTVGMLNVNVRAPFFTGIDCVSTGKLMCATPRRVSALRQARCATLPTCRRDSSRRWGALEGQAMEISSRESFCSNVGSNRFLPYEA